jgi:hypothetical protein
MECGKTWTHPVASAAREFPLGLLLPRRNNLIGRSGATIAGLGHSINGDVNPGLQVG